MNILQFHFGSCETILFKSWTVQTPWMFFLATIIIFAVSFGYEGLKHMREKLYTAIPEPVPRLAKVGSEESNINQAPRKSCATYIISQRHIVQTLLHVVQVLLSYMLMLIAMTFNMYLILAIVLGAAAGYFCFGWIRTRLVDWQEHCH